jgi:hypothetical protein
MVASGWKNSKWKRSTKCCFCDANEIETAIYTVVSPQTVVVQFQKTC